jgi:hypothetical protein
MEELGHRARGAAGDLLEGVGRVVVLAGEDRPLARDEQLSRPRRYPGGGEALEELPLGRDPEGDGLAELRRQQLERPRRPSRTCLTRPGWPVPSPWSSANAARSIGESASPYSVCGRVDMICA